MILSLVYLILGMDYWFNPKIHNFGNRGILGNVHAASTPLFTKFIDKVVYSGVNIRKNVYSNLNGSVIDLCCGTGYSTKPENLGIDTSTEMINFAHIFNPKGLYKVGNAELFGKDQEFDYVTCMFAFHEMTNEGHVSVIKNSKRICKNKIIVVDIAPEYKPSNIMLTGEPYILDYLKTIRDTFIEHDFTEEKVIPNHVSIWTHEL
jgi:ubiquinone/menaquinone biosynthesis C-methylase UbiE